MGNQKGRDRKGKDLLKLGEGKRAVIQKDELEEELEGGQLIDEKKYGPGNTVVSGKEKARAFPRNPWATIQFFT